MTVFINKIREDCVGNPQTEKHEEYAIFDILRFILASAVLLNHIGVLSWANSGNLAVQVFFALSGWLIGGVLLDTKPTELNRFFYNRSTRVWIPYLFAVTALYTASFLFESVRSPRWFEFLTYDLTFTHNWFTLRSDAQTAFREMPLGGTGNGLWSISVEEQFYIFAPIFITLLPFGKRVLPWVCIATLAYLSASQYGAISLGVLSAIFFKKYGAWHLTSLGIRAIFIAMTMSILAMIFDSDLLQTYYYSAPIFAICIVLLCAKPMKRSKVTRWFGGVSFPLYLNCWIGIFALHAFNKRFDISDSWFYQPLEFIAGLCAATVTYFLIDVPVMKYRSDYFKPIVGTILGVASYLLLLGGIIYGLSVSVSPAIAVGS